MDKIIGIFTKGTGESKKDDDVVDRLSSRYTVVLLIAFTFVVSTALYVGSPINCWCDKHFTGNHIKYTNNFCWVRNTYYLPFDEEIPREHEHEKKKEILYYQWLPFILLAQAFLFWMPSAVWHGLNQKAGVDCDTILATSGKLLNTPDPSKREDIMKIVVHQMDRFLGSRREVVGSRMCSAAGVRRFFVCCDVQMGNYLVSLYMVVKGLYLMNAIAQLYILNIILRTNYSMYGHEFMANIAEGEHWMDSPAFPRITMCDMNVRRLGNIHRYTVQCVLPINMYTEKIYAFLWFWMVMVAVVTGVNMVLWLSRLFMGSDRFQYLRTHMAQTREAPKEASINDTLRRFMDTYLRQDGVFVLRLIGHNTNNITVTDITERLFNFWQEKKDMPLHEDGDEVSPSAPILGEAPPLPPKPGHMYPALA